MDKTLILFLCGFGVGMFVGNLELPSDLSGLESHEKIIIAGTEIWLIVHYVVALTTLPVLAITYLKKKITPPLRGLPFAFNAGLLCSFILIGLIQVITQIVTT